MPRWFRRLAIVIAIGLAGAWLAALIVLFVFQRDFQYDRSGRLFDRSSRRTTGPMP